jgi:hypothetical protein
LKFSNLEDKLEGRDNSMSLYNFQEIHLMIQSDPIENSQYAKLIPE